jgi:signal transduction histidine kinase
MSLWAEPAAPGAPARGWRDWALAAAFCLLAVIEGVARPALPGGFVAVLLVFLLAPTLLWRRSHPLAMVTIAFAVTAVAPALTHGVPPEAASLVFVALLPYSLLRWGSGRDIVIGVGVMAARIVVAIAFDQMTVAAALAAAAVIFAVAALGLAMRFRAVVRLREFEKVRLVERERLARDLHDTVAHHVSAMAIRAQAGLALGPSSPQAALDALRVIEAEASAALAEMRTVVKALRAAPTLADLGALTGTDSRVDLDVTGDLASVAPAVGAAVFRLAQEAVTNARRHSREATHISVRVAADDTSVHLRVTDEGLRSPASPAPAGFGLAGMRERAALLGGVFSAGPDPDRGWSVTATLPRTGPAS